MRSPGLREGFILATNPREGFVLATYARLGVGMLARRLSCPRHPVGEVDVPAWRLHTHDPAVPVEPPAWRLRIYDMGVTVPFWRADGWRACVEA